MLNSPNIYLYLCRVPVVISHRLFSSGICKSVGVPVKKQKGVIIIHMNPQKWRCNQNNVPFIRAEWLLSCDLNCCSALSWSVLNNMIQINYRHQSWTCLLKHFCDFIAIMHFVIIMSGQPVYAFLEGDALWQCHIIRLEHCKMKHIDIK